jgi:hypothetical protein
MMRSAINHSAATFSVQLKVSASLQQLSASTRHRAMRGQQFRQQRTAMPNDRQRGHLICRRFIRS